MESEVHLRTGLGPVPMNDLTREPCEHVTPHKHDKNGCSHRENPNIVLRANGLAEAVCNDSPGLVICKTLRSEIELTQENPL